MSYLVVADRDGAVDVVANCLYLALQQGVFFRGGFDEALLLLFQLNFLLEQLVGILLGLVPRRLVLYFKIAPQPAYLLLGANLLLNLVDLAVHLGRAVLGCRDVPGISTKRLPFPVVVRAIRDALLRWSSKRAMISSTSSTLACLRRWDSRTFSGSPPRSLMKSLTSNIVSRIDSFDVCVVGLGPVRPPNSEWTDGGEIRCDKTGGRETDQAAGGRCDWTYLVTSSERGVSGRVESQGLLAVEAGKVVVVQRAD